MSILSCDKNDSGYFPLRKGLAWQYDIEKQTVEGTTRQKDIIQDLGLSSDGDEPAHLHVSLSGTRFHYIQDDSGIRLEHIYLPGNSQKISNKSLVTVFNYPLEAGVQWRDFITTSTLRSHDRNANDVIESVPVTVTIQSTNETVSVPAGKYRNCVVIVSTGEKHIQKGKYAYQGTMIISIRNTRWYAEGTGLVKEVHSEETDILEYPGSGYVKMLDRVTRS